MTNTTSEIRDWAAEHGSQRLRRLCLEGIECTAVYRDERLTLEYPGWRLLRDVRGEDLEPRNPPMAALVFLDEARASCGERTKGAVLSFWVADVAAGEAATDVWRGYVALVEDANLGWLVYGGPLGFSTVRAERGRSGSMEGKGEQDENKITRQDSSL